MRVAQSPSQHFFLVDDAHAHNGNPEIANRPTAVDPGADL
jgi:hypothetical protein